MVRVGTSDDKSRHIPHVGGEAGGCENPNELLGRDQHLAAEVAALLLRCKLVFEVNTRRARLDHGLHELEGVERSAEAGLCIRHQRDVPLVRDDPVDPLDVVGALQGLVDALDKVGNAVDRVEALVRVHLTGKVVVGRDLPAADIDGLETRPDLLHGLVARHRAQGANAGRVSQQLP